MAEHPQLSIRPTRALSQPEASGGRRARWIYLVVLCALGALLGLNGSEGNGNDGLRTWQATVILVAALLAGAAVASKDWRQGIWVAVLILLFGGGSKMASWATGGWAGGLLAAAVGGVIGAAFGAFLALLPAHPLFVRRRT